MCVCTTISPTLLGRNTFSTHTHTLAYRLLLLLLRLPQLSTQQFG